MIRRLLLLVCALIVLVVSPRGVRADEPSGAPKDEAELRGRLLAVMAKSRIPGLGAVIADRTGARSVFGLGKADVAQGIDAGPDTVFRTGSISKLIVGLAAARLAREGRIELTAKVAEIAPEIRFDNRWEATDPLRLVHLLEHTAGFDDMSQREWAHNDAKPATLREALDFDPRARVVRWRPGTRFSYSNVGPAFAAYLLEKVTGQVYESYVQKTFFQKLGMDTATLLFSPEMDARLTRLYRPDGKTEIPYFHFLMRPSGSLNASPRDMGKLITLLLNRGKSGAAQLVTAEDVTRTETPTTYFGARAGLSTGYGLGNYTLLEQDGLVWHGHNGGLDGARAELYYVTEAGIGYFFGMNGDSEAYREIGGLFRAYLARDIPKPPLPAAADPSGKPAEYAGWYETSSPRIEGLRFLDRLAGLTHVTATSDGLDVRGWLGRPRGHYVATTSALYRRDKDPEATLALLSDGVEGPLIQTKDLTLKPIPAALAYLMIFLSGATLLGALSVIAFAPVWLVRRSLGKMRRVKHFGLRLWPLAATIGLFTAPIFLAKVESLGTLNAGSAALTTSTLLFAIGAGGGLIHASRVPRDEVHRFTHVHTLVTSALFSIATAYLGWYGFIGVHTW